MATTGEFFLIPLTNQPEAFTISLAGTEYSIVVKWNDMAQSWLLDIADSNNVSIASSIPLITGDDLLDGLAYLGIQGQLFVFTNQGKYPDEVPTLDNLGVDSNLYFFTSVING